MKKKAIAGIILALSLMTVASCGSRTPDVTPATSVAGIEADAGTSVSDQDNEEQVTVSQENNDNTTSDASEEKKQDSETSISTSDKEEKTEDGKVDDEDKAEDTTDYEAMYKKILSRSCEILSNEDYWDNMGDGETGLYEAAAYENDPLSSVSYSIVDISGDKIPELIISYAAGYAEEILAVYTISNGSTQLVLEGYNRSSYVYLGDGKFGYEGSAGAAYTAYGLFKISQDGTTLVNEDFYFSDEDEDFNPLYYHNTIGAWDKDKSEQIDITNEEFIEIGTGMRSDTARLYDAILFLAYASEVKSEKANSEVIIAWANDVLSDASVYDDIVIDTADYTSKVAFSTKSYAKDFKILKLEVEMDGDEIVYNCTEVYSREELNKEKLVVATIQFFGDMPTYGFSYIDETGKERKFAIQESGKDGSLDLFEFF